MYYNHTPGMPGTLELVGLMFCNCCKRYEPWDDEDLKTDLAENKTPFLVKIGDKMGKRMDLGAEPEPGDLPQTWGGCMCTLMAFFMIGAMATYQVGKL